MPTNLSMNHNQSSVATIVLTKNGSPDITSTVQGFNGNSPAFAIVNGPDNRTFNIRGIQAGVGTATFVGPGGAQDTVSVTVAQAPDQFTLVVTVGPPVAQ